MSYPKTIEKDKNFIEYEDFTDDYSDISDILYESDFYKQDFDDVERHDLSCDDLYNFFTYDNNSDVVFEDPNNFVNISDINNEISDNNILHYDNNYHTNMSIYDESSLCETSYDVDFLQFSSKTSDSDIEICDKNLIDNDIEIINFSNNNIELENINLKNLRKYKSSLYKHMLNKPEESCSICYCLFNNCSRIITLKCGHCFHSKCVIPWISTRETCPKCRCNII